MQQRRESGRQGTSRSIVNRASVQALGYANPVGKAVVVEPRDPAPARLTIDGVVDNFHFRPLYQRVQPPLPPPPAAEIMPPRTFGPR